MSCNGVREKRFRPQPASPSHWNSLRPLPALKGRLASTSVAPGACPMSSNFGSVPHEKNSARHDIVTGIINTADRHASLRAAQTVGLSRCLVGCFPTVSRAGNDGNDFVAQAHTVNTWTTPVLSEPHRPKSDDFTQARNQEQIISG